MTLGHMTPNLNLSVWPTVKGHSGDDDEHGKTKTKNSRHGGKYIYVYLDINKIFQMLIGKLVSLFSHLI